MGLRANIREFQVQIEATPGTAETLVAGDLLVRMREGDTFGKLTDLFETLEVQGSSARRPHLTGFSSVDATVSHILRGPASQSVVPAVSDLLRAAMMEEKAVSNNPIGAVTGGPFADGETITSTSASGKVFRATDTPATELKFTDSVGDFNGEVITGGTSGATATASGAKVANGYLYRPVDSNFGGSDTKHHVTAGFNQDGLKLIGFGMLANLQMQFDVGRPVVITQRFVGGFQSHADVAIIKPSTYPEEGNSAPRFLSATLKLGSYSPTDIRSLALNVETNPELREDAQLAGGVLYADYSKDEPIVTVDPAAVKVADKDFWTELENGTKFALSWKVGSTAGLIWEFFADACQYNRVDIGAERNLATFPLEIRCGGTATQPELVIWQH